jgi:hypothetical protein
MLWKPIPGFLDYEVSEHGDVCRGAARLTPERTTGNGRKRFGLSKGGQLFRMKAHQLVALAFLGPPPFEGAEVCHKDGFHHNNHYSNLRWDTAAGNSADTVKHKAERKQKTNYPLSQQQHLEIEAAQLLASAR